jgi:hypothetical protein
MGIRRGGMRVVPWIQFKGIRGWLSKWFDQFDSERIGGDYGD